MQNARILIADDDPVQRLDLKAMLEDLGHCIAGEADNGETACYLAQSLRPDLIILDIRMPRRNGLEAAESISRARLGPVMLLTAYSDLPMIDQANRAGVLAYLVKPYRQQELQPAISIAISRYREALALEGALHEIQEQIESDRVVENAKKVLMRRQSLSDREAFRRLQAQALTTKRSLREISEAIMLIDELTYPPA